MMSVVNLELLKILILISLLDTIEAIVYAKDSIYIGNEKTLVPPRKTMRSASNRTVL